MAPPANGGAGGGAARGGGRQQQEQQGVGQMLTGIIRVAVFWYFASKFFSPKKPLNPNQPSSQISNLFHKAEPLVRLLLSPNKPHFFIFLCMRVCVILFLFVLIISFGY